MLLAARGLPGPPGFETCNNLIQSSYKVYALTQSLYKAYAQLIRSLYKVYTKLIQRLYEAYTKLTQSLYKTYTELTQSFYKSYTKLIQSSVLLGVSKVMNSDLQNL